LENVTQSGVFESIQEAGHAQPVMALPADDRRTERKQV
jgi:hypothetical protein